MTLTKSAMTITSLGMAMLFGGGLFLFMNMNMYAKNFIESQASKTLGVSVSIGSLEVSVQERTAQVKNITIGNPKGFEKPYAAKIENVNVVFGSIVDKLVTFKDIDVGEAVVNLEVRDNTTNLATIKKQVKAQPDSAAKEAAKVIIDKLTVSQAQIHPASVLFTKDDLPPVNVPDIVMTGVGSKEGGVLVNEAIAQIWLHISRKLESQALNSGLLEGVSDEALQDMGLGFRQRFQENLQDTVNEKVDSLNKGLDKMFNE